MADVLTFIITGAENKPLLPGDFELSPIQETIEGNYRSTLKTKISGDLTITPRVESDTMDSLKAIVTVMALPPVEAYSLSLSHPPQILADGYEHTYNAILMRNELRLPVHDWRGRVSYAVVNKDGSPAKDFQLKQIPSVNAHELIVELRGGTPGSYYIVPYADGVPMMSRANPVELLTTEIRGFHRHSHLFPTHSKFPTNAFIGATISPTLSNGAKVKDYEWTSTADWITYIPGRNAFYFAEKPVGGSRTVTITAKRKDSHVSHSYTFTLNKWFTPIKGNFTWNEAMRECNARGLTLASKIDVTTGDSSRGLGTLLSEWKSLNPAFLDVAWINEPAGAGRYMALHSIDTTGAIGVLMPYNSAKKLAALCVESLK